MTIATLVAVTQTPVVSKYKKTEETYEYMVDGESVKFHAHPTKAWNWVILSGKEHVAARVVKAMCNAGFDMAQAQTLSI